MNRMMEAYKILAPKKDLDSFRTGYYCRQETIDILGEENHKLNKVIEENKQNKQTIESLERLFKALVKHEQSECGSCIYCENQWKIIETIEEKLEEFKR